MSNSKGTRDMIEQYLRQYMSMPNTDFAVFINGDWGCGKTFFITKFIKKLKGKKCWKISLNGVRDESDIAKQMLENVMPFLKGKGGKIGRMVLTAVSDAISKKYPIDLKELFGGKDDLCANPGKGDRENILVCL